MKQFLSYIALIAVILLSSCKNELDVLAPGKEMVSVYAVLNPNTPVQNIRINKVFVTTGDANVAATEEKSVNYNAGELIVTLERYNVGGTSKQLTTKGNGSKTEIVLTETVITTPSGAFSNQQRIWQTSDRLIPSGEYKLIIKKAADNTEIASARTIMIDSVKPLTNVMPFCLYNHPTNPNLSFPIHTNYVIDSPPGTGTKQIAYVDYSVSTKTQKIDFKTVADAKVYNVTIRLHYLDIFTNTDTVKQYADFNLPNYVSQKAIAGESMAFNFQFIAQEFYDNIGLEMSKKSKTNLQKRKIQYIEYIILSATDNLYTFMQVNAPSNTIAQDKPYYSNIGNGVGIFACQSSSSITKLLWNDFTNQIIANSATNSYLFAN